MRALPLLVSTLLLMTAVAPTATATIQPPYCPVCVIILAIVVPCVVAEATQDALNQGDGCAIINQEQAALACAVRSVEAQVGLASPCPSP